MAYYLLTSKQFNALTISTEEKDRKARNIAGTSFVYESARPPAGLSTRDAISKRDLVGLMKGTDWQVEDPSQPTLRLYL